MNHKSLIIVFEGVDGVGKTTHLQATSKFLAHKGINHISTQELSGYGVRDQARSMLMSDLDSIEELLVISAARRWHWRNIVEPALTEGKIVLLDRFIESTWAYQAGGRRVPDYMIKFLEKETWSSKAPDLTIYISGKSHRIHKRDRFETEDNAFFDRVKAAYNARSNPSWLLLDSSVDFQSNQTLIEEKILSLMGELTDCGFRQH